MTFPYVLSAEQMRTVDREAVERTGLPSLILMENAGRGAAAAILRRLPAPPGGHGSTVAVVCGSGNNGGDGFVIARHLGLAGAGVRVLLSAPRAKVAGDAAVMLRALEGLGGVSLVDLSASGESAVWSEALSPAGVIVDALLGTGLRSDVAGTAAVAIGAMNEAAGLKVAIDLPSGLDADSGRPHGSAFRADVTLTMGARKLGLAINPEAILGDLEVVDLGIPILPPAALGPYCHWLEEAGIRASLPRRGPTAHKGTGGHLVVVAGSAGKTGAALLTSRAALRTGAGLVTIASTAAGQVALDAKVVEAMTVAYAPGDDAAGDSFDLIARLCTRAHARALAVGPGIPLGDGMRVVVERLVRDIPLPMVVDADGLNMLGAQGVPTLAAAPASRVITPHPGEMARLCGLGIAEVQSDRLAVARQFAAASRAIVVLKGARTLIVAPDGRAFVNPTVEPGLATAGSGDVLTGVVASLLAQGMEPLGAALAAVFLHGRAGVEAARRHGPSGVVAGDLPELVADVKAAWR